MKQANIDRLEYLLGTDPEDQIPEPGDMKLLKKTKKRVFELIAEKMLADHGKTTFAQHKTVQ